MTKVLMTLLLLSTAPAWAGGDSWAFRVRSVTPTKTGHHLVLVPAETSDRFPACPTVAISVDFQPTQWGANSASLPNEGTNREAIVLLRGVVGTPDVIRFGEMGTGLSPARQGAACDFMSRGLRILEEPNGVKAVYSFFRVP